MAHHLAEAICELAAPGLQPCFIRMQSRVSGDPAHILLLHVRPRPLAAGLEIAVFSGETTDLDGMDARIGRQGIVFTVQQTQAGLHRFVADLLASSPQMWGDNDNGPYRMTLPLQPSSFFHSWDSVELDLLRPSQVQRRAAQAGGAAPAPADDADAALSVHISLPLNGDEWAPYAEVRNQAHRYACEQENLKQRLEQQQRKDKEQAAALEQPDSSAAFDQRWRALRDQVMADLQDSLLAVLRQALRARGTVDLFPGGPPAPPAAPAAPDAPAAPAGGAAGP